MTEFFLTTFDFLVSTLSTSGQGWLLLLVATSVLLQGGWVLVYFLNREARYESYQAHKKMNKIMSELQAAANDLQWTANRLTDHLDKLIVEGPEQVRQQLDEIAQLVRELWSRR